MDAPTTPPYPPPRDSPTKGDEGEGGGGILALRKRRRRAKQNFGKIFGEYSSLSEMITNVNGGQKSDLVEKILHKQMQRLL